MLPAYIENFLSALSSLMFFKVAFIEYTMDPNHTAHKGANGTGFIVFDSMIKSSLKCT